MTETIKCRVCQGDRPHDGRYCLGCGTPIQNAIDRSKPNKGTSTPCPRCNRYHGHKEIEPGRFVCGNCGGVFEGDDFDMVDTRPLENAIKKERNRKRSRRNG